MSFANAHNFTITNFSAVDVLDRGAGTLTFQSLVQEACLGAGHRSKERYDPPKCHPETRKAVIDDIMSWVDSECSKEHILWMSGPAGAGKSSIAQTICERSQDEGKLLSAFFFSRTATGTGRDDGDKLVTTIACQMATAIPETKTHIINLLESDSAVLSYSMDVQMEKLVLKPISQVYADMDQSRINNTNKCFPYLVVIDGLDECNDAKMQSRIITMIAMLLSRTNIRLRFLIASRPELEIRNTFESSFVSNICSRVVLNEHYNPDDDIRIYLQSEFASLKREHTLNSSLLENSNWPTYTDIGQLVCRSSGQFIYASTIMKYLKHPRRDPRDVLKSIINYEPNTKDNIASFNESPQPAFAQLDTLYTQILNAAASNLEGQTGWITTVIQVILFGRDSLKYRLLSMDTMASFISMNQTGLELLLSDLHSIIYVPKINTEFLRFYHASFGDFLTDFSRSGDFYIAREEAHKVLAHLCFIKLTEHNPCNRLDNAEDYSRHNYFSHIEESGFDKVLLKELHYTPRLRTLLDLLLQPERGIYDNDEAMSTFADEISVLLEFDFNDTGGRFVRPKYEQHKDLCNRMVEVIEEILLSLYPSVDEAESSLIDAIITITSSLTRSLRRCWLAMLLDIPERGKDLYLDSNKSMSLFIKICGTLEYQNYGPNMWWHPTVLNYLLKRIKPAADTDTNAFRDTLMKLSYNRELMSHKRDEMEYVLKSAEVFIQKCVELKTRCLEQTTVEDRVKPNRLQRILRSLRRKPTQRDT